MNIYYHDLASELMIYDKYNVTCIYIIQKSMSKKILLT
jgi:hypothetical protein